MTSTIVMNEWNDFNVTETSAHLSFLSLHASTRRSEIYHGLPYTNIFSPFCPQMFYALFMLIVNMIAKMGYKFSIAKNLQLGKQCFEFIEIFK